MSNSYNIVARVSQIPSGTLELNHTAYTGTDPAAHTGTGFYYISAILKKADGSKIKFDETQGVISIDKFAEMMNSQLHLKLNVTVITQFMLFTRVKQADILKLVLRIRI